MRTDWKQHQYGGGSSRNLTRGVELTVVYSMVKGEGYYWTLMGLTGKARFRTAEEAQESAERAAKKILTDALESLAPMRKAVK